MGTEFEDENAKEKLKAMLNKQFGIGDVSLVVVASISVRVPSSRTPPIYVRYRCPAIMPRSYLVVSSWFGTLGCSFVAPCAVCEGAGNVILVAVAILV